MEPLAEPFGIFDVMHCTERQRSLLVFTQGAHHLGRATNNHAAVWKLLALGHQSACAHDAAFANLCTVEHDGTDPYERAIAYRASMQHHLVSYRHVGTNGERLANVCMQHTGILNIGSRTDANHLGVATNDCAKPYASVRTQLHIAHDLRTICNPGSVMDARRNGVKFINGHGGNFQIWKVGNCRSRVNPQVVFLIASQDYLQYYDARNKGEMPVDCILETKQLTKEFKGFVAVDKVDLRVKRGTIHALIGPNGAGKTTCFNLLTKFLNPTSGQIIFDGEDITQLAPAQIARLGVIRSFQISAVFPHLTVLENVRVALQRALNTSFHFWQSERSLNALDQRAMELLDSVDLQQFATLTAVELSYGRKRALEIATTLAMNPKLMLLDEPTQGMGLEDVDRIKQLIKKVAASRTVLMVEHNMSVVSSIADTITVLQRGATLAEGPYAEVSKNPAVIEAYMGSANVELQGAH